MRRFLLALILLTPIATASPEVADEVGDCALPYGNAYLDVTRAWISDENETEFAVNLRLASWSQLPAEGSGYAVEFANGGERYGVVGVFSRSVLPNGWSFSTGTASDGDIGDLVNADGWFTGTDMTVLFPKIMLAQPEGRLGEFWAGTADLRPALPIILAGAPISPGDAWLICDEAEGQAEYELMNETGSEEAISTLQSGEQKSTPGTGVAGVVGVAVSLVALLRRGLRSS